MNKISVILITKNEARNIYECLQSVSWADEIIVVDSGSSDDTLSIAKQFTDKVFFNEWKGFAEQKSYAMHKARNNWVLSIDADERVTENLKDEILNSDLDEFDGYRIKRDNYFLGKLIRGCGWGNDYQLRLFKKSKTRLTDRLVHEGFEVEGKVGQLKHSMLHFSYRNFSDAFTKINHYSTLEAIEKQNKKNVNTFTIVFTPIIAFLQHFFIRKGFIDGIYGLFVSILHAITKLQVQLKIWELKNQKRNN
ncbi:MULTISPECIES: glycosyltransferase family 2 protein [Ignavibacterium]|jgi:glycosyltransferase involved in cell wall biosynthesis|uniref:glycosyltransferase family 2 protein n=2 Tax=Ignavibacteriaceae TaxID=795749 RepID=UPI0025C3C5C7|nr:MULTISPECIES: glycosyltransferase family 2 protein [Ignavibacterium]MBI5662174.1 glycosyltransferase family 2 protein [Ignavibacterium album]